MSYRYLFLLQIHLNKRRINKKLKIEEGDVSTSSFRKIFLFLSKIMTSPSIFYIVPFLWSLFLMFVSYLIFAIHRFECSLKTYQDMRNFYYVVVLLFYLNLVAIFIFDVLFNIKLIFKCKIKQIFVDDDPFQNRLDMYTYLISFPFIVMWVVQLPIPFLLNSAILDFALLFGLWSSGLQALVITIVKKIYYTVKTSRRVIEDVSIQAAMQPEIIEVFTKFCEFEWSVENIMLKKDIVKFQRLKSAFERKKLCEIIKKRYLLSSSPFEVNCSSRILSEVIKKIDSNQMEDNLFEELEKTVDINLSDTLSRFFFSSLYVEHVHDMKEKNKILGLD
jgi:hypothetical protein